MGGLRICKRHHMRINNPFLAPTTRCSPFIHGKLSYDPNKIPLQRSFRIGEDFELHWMSNNGGHLSVLHQSLPDKNVWSTVPREAFIYAAAVGREVLESRGSFVVIDDDVQFICKHQTVEGIRIVHEQDVEMKTQKNLLSSFSGSNGKECSSCQL